MILKNPFCIEFIFVVDECKWCELNPPSMTALLSHFSSPFSATFPELHITIPLFCLTMIQLGFFLISLPYKGFSWEAMSTICFFFRQNCITNATVRGYQSCE